MSQYSEGIWTYLSWLIKCLWQGSLRCIILPWVTTLPNTGIVSRVEQFHRRLRNWNWHSSMASWAPRRTASITSTLRLQIWTWKQRHTHTHELRQPQSTRIQTTLLNLCSSLWIFRRINEATMRFLISSLWNQTFLLVGFQLYNFQAVVYSGTNLIFCTPPALSIHHPWICGENLTFNFKRPAVKRQQHCASVKSLYELDKVCLCPSHSKVLWREPWTHCCS